jgi:hypothetical protein
MVGDLERDRGWGGGGADLPGVLQEAALAGSHIPLAEARRGTLQQRKARDIYPRPLLFSSHDFRSSLLYRTGQKVRISKTGKLARILDVKPTYHDWTYFVVVPPDGEAVYNDWFGEAALAASN